MPDRELLSLLALLPAGFVAGVVNVIAGGGSFLTLPVLMATGLPVHVANGTNRIAILLQALVATRTYQRAGEFDVALYKRLLPPVLAGAIVGALLATRIDPERLRRVFGVLFLVMAGVLLFRRKRQAEKVSTLASLPKPLKWLIYLAIGAYGGFLQAGFGLWILMGAVWLQGVDALRANAVKLPLIMTFTVPALGIFLFAGQVDWLRGTILGIGSVAGTVVGVRLSLKGGASLIVKAVTAVLFGTGVYLVL